MGLTKQNNKEELKQFEGQYVGYEFKGQGTNQKNEPWTKLSMKFKTQEGHNRTFNVFTPIKGKEINTFVPGKNYKLGYKEYNTGRKNDEGYDIITKTILWINESSSSEQDQYTQHQGHTMSQYQQPLIKQELPINPDEKRVWDSNNFENGEEWISIAVGHGISEQRAKEIFKMLA